VTGWGTEEVVLMGWAMVMACRVRQDKTNNQHQC
jgi:hypothetical protein